MRQCQSCRVVTGIGLVAHIPGDRKLENTPEQEEYGLYVYLVDGDNGRSNVDNVEYVVVPYVRDLVWPDEGSELVRLDTLTRAYAK